MKDKHTIEIWGKISHQRMAKLCYDIMVIYGADVRLRSNTETAMHQARRWGDKR